jgi:hypothetical protein
MEVFVEILHFLEISVEFPSKYFHLKPTHVQIILRKSLLQSSFDRIKNPRCGDFNINIVSSVTLTNVRARADLQLIESLANDKR